MRILYIRANSIKDLHRKIGKLKSNYNILEQSETNKIGNNYYKTLKVETL